VDHTSEHGAGAAGIAMGGGEAIFMPPSPHVICYMENH
jgi:hypothetical protein